MKVKVYRNLKHGKRALPLYSIMHKGRVIDTRHYVVLREVKFVVSDSGRRRVLKTGRRNVHAFAVGELVDSGGWFVKDECLPVKVSYNPHYINNFYNTFTLEPVREARVAVFHSGGTSIAL